MGNFDAHNNYYSREKIMRSASIPMKFCPTFDEIEKAIEAGFSAFNRCPPTVTHRLYGSSTNLIPYIEGENENEWAWVLIVEWPNGQGENNNCKFLCDVQSRGDDLFAAIVCYSLCDAFGKVIEDDAGYLRAGQEFLVGEFKEALKIKMNFL